jgi:hypothetical protein
MFDILCPSCLRTVPSFDAHVFEHIDIATGESFIPVKRVVDNWSVSLSPEDYSCFDSGADSDHEAKSQFFVHVSVR